MGSLAISSNKKLTDQANIQRENYKVVEHDRLTSKNMKKMINVLAEKEKKRALIKLK